jgi:hypothetical protein
MCQDRTFREGDQFTNIVGTLCRMGHRDSRQTALRLSRGTVPLSQICNRAR